MRTIVVIWSHRVTARLDGQKCSDRWGAPLLARGRGASSRAAYLKMSRIESIRYGFSAGVGGGLIAGGAEEAAATEAP